MVQTPCTGAVALSAGKGRVQEGSTMGRVLWLPSRVGDGGVRTAPGHLCLGCTRLEVVPTVDCVVDSGRLGTAGVAVARSVMGSLLHPPGGGGIVSRNRRVDRGCMSSGKCWVFPCGACLRGGRMGLGGAPVSPDLCIWNVCDRGDRAGAGPGHVTWERGGSQLESESFVVHCRSDNVIPAHSYPVGRVISASERMCQGVRSAY